MKIEKQIGLDHKQRRRIISLCNIAWPTKDFRVHALHLNIEVIQSSNKEETMFTHSTHWFEFCVNTLLPAYKRSYYDYRRRLSEGPIHIVDYIWETQKIISNGNKSTRQSHRSIEDL